MNKGSHFIGQPAYGHLINLLDRTGILEISRSNGGERYVKNFRVASSADNALRGHKEV